MWSCGLRCLSCSCAITYYCLWRTGWCLSILTSITGQCGLYPLRFTYANHGAQVHFDPSRYKDKSLASVYPCVVDISWVDFNNSCMSRTGYLYFWKDSCTSRSNQGTFLSKRMPQELFCLAHPGRQIWMLNLLQLSTIEGLCCGLGLFSTLVHYSLSLIKSCCLWITSPCCSWRPLCSNKIRVAVIIEERLSDMYHKSSLACSCQRT